MKEILTEIQNKLGLSWAKLSSSWDWTLIKERCQAKFLEGHLNELGLLIGPNTSGNFVNEAA